MRQCIIARENYNSFNPLYTDRFDHYLMNRHFCSYYIENVMGFKGDGEFVGKVGIEIRDRIIVLLFHSQFLR